MNVNLARMQPAILDPRTLIYLLERGASFQKETQEPYWITPEMNTMLEQGDSKSIALLEDAIREFRIIAPANRFSSLEERLHNLRTQLVESTESKFIKVLPESGQDCKEEMKLVDLGLNKGSSGRLDFIGNGSPVKKRATRVFEGLVKPLLAFSLKTRSRIFSVGVSFKNWLSSIISSVQSPDGVSLGTKIGNLYVPAMADGRRNLAKSIKIFEMIVLPAILIEEFLRKMNIELGDVPKLDPVRGVVVAIRDP